MNLNLRNSPARAGCFQRAALLIGLMGVWAGGAALAQSQPSAALSVKDDDGRTVTLAAPARRIVSLAPHTTELLFNAGAGAQVVATVRYGDYPAAAKALPVVGDSASLDLERIVALKPDLLVVWLHGSSAKQLERLAALKLPIFHSEPKRLADVGDSLRRLGVLAGTSPAANTAAAAYEAELARLQQRYSQRPPLRVFYQVWHQPLMSINDGQIISDVIRLCGGVNVFGSATATVPTVNAEAVIAARPQVLATSTLDGTVDDSIAHWRGFKHFEPIAKEAVVVIPSDLISRPTPRLLQGAARMCEGLDQVRAGQPVRLPAIPRETPPTASGGAR